MSAVTDGNITDLRENSRSGGAAPAGRLAWAPPAADQTNITTEVDLTGLSVTVDVPADRPIKVTGTVLFRDVGGTGDRVLVRAYEDATVIQHVLDWGPASSDRERRARCQSS